MFFLHWIYFCLHFQITYRTVGKFTYPYNISLIKNHILLICSIFLNSDLMNQCRFWCWFQKWAQFRPDLPGSLIKWKIILDFFSFLSKKDIQKKAQFTNKLFLKHYVCKFKLYTILKPIFSCSQYNQKLFYSVFLWYFFCIDIILFPNYILQTRHL